MGLVIFFLGGGEICLGFSFCLYFPTGPGCLDLGCCLCLLLTGPEIGDGRQAK